MTTAEQILTGIMIGILGCTVAVYVVLEVLGLNVIIV